MTQGTIEHQHSTTFNPIPQRSYCSLQSICQDKAPVDVTILYVVWEYAPPEPNSETYYGLNDDGCDDT